MSLDFPNMAEPKIPPVQFTVDTEVDAGGVITQTLHDACGAIMVWVMATRDRQVSAALVTLGWTPPGEGAGDVVQGLPARAGFYWWREVPADEWRLVRVKDFSADPAQPHLSAYDVEHCAWGGVSILLWEEHRLRGEWRAVPRP